MNETIVQRVFALPGRSTRAVVDLDAIEGNVATVKSAVGTNVAVMAVVKANGYGHGAIGVSRTALAAGATSLGVATVDEGVQLRRAGIDAPILVLSPIDESEIVEAAQCDLQITIGDFELVVRAFERLWNAKVSNRLGVHLKVDTGMHRFGVTPKSAAGIAAAIDRSNELKLNGVFTHFAQADEPDLAPTRDQLALFNRVVEDIEEEGVAVGVVHSANSAATLGLSQARNTMVRLGIALYGLNPSSDRPVAAGMRPALTIVSRLRRVSDLAPGEAVSYGATYRAVRSERIGLVPIGYADGYRRGFSNRGIMSVNGSSCPIRGRVCMDQTVIGLPNESVSATVGDTVVVGGAWNNASVPALDALANWADTINYEVASGLSARVPRFYVRNGDVVGTDSFGSFRTLD